MVPFLGTLNIRCHYDRDPKRDHNFDNHPGDLKLVDKMLPILEQELLADMIKGFRSRRGYQVTTAFPLRMA